MKKFILFCSFCMAAALLYGAVDFLISKGNGDLSNLYDEKVPSANNSTKEENKDTSSFKHASFFQNVNNSASTQPKATTAKNKKAKKVKKRKITSEEFSRAPLREEIEEVVVADTAAQK